MPDATPPPVVAFEADRVDADAELRDVTLSGHVRLARAPFVVRADRLRVVRRPDGRLEVVGPLVLSPCPCDDPPLSFGVDRAVLDEDGSATLVGARVLLFGREVLPVPRLWLRAPDRVGLLPPGLAWRGAQGPLASVGVHVPLAPLGERAHLDVRPGVYLRGGHELAATVADDDTRARASVRWDRMGGDLVAVEGEGATRGRDRVAFRVDAVRGERARSGSLSLDAAARAYDRADVLASAELPLRPSLGLRMIAPRGIGPVTWGPRVALGQGAALGPLAVLVTAEGGTLAGPDGATHLGRLDVDAASATWLGVARASAAARGSAAGFLSPRAGASDLAATARVGLGLPLARRHGDALSTIEPGLRVTAAAARVEGERDDAPGRPLARGSGSAVIPAVALATGLGAVDGDAARLDLSAGALAEAGAAVTPAFRAELAADAALARVRAEGAALGLRGWMRGHGGADDGAVALATASLGPRRGPTVGGGVEGLVSASPLAARALAPELSPLSSGWLQVPGWTGRLDAGVPLTGTGSLRVGAEAYWDLSAGERLAERLTLGYAHPCGCLAAFASAGHRRGRDGVDAALTLGLVP